MARSDKVLLLTPITDAAAHAERYLHVLGSLSYPSELISIGLLESDSRDWTFEVFRSLLPELNRRFRRANLWKRDFGLTLPPGRPRGAQEVELDRRKELARARNHLLFRALDDEDWVLWLDVAIVETPADILDTLLGTGRPIVQPNCVLQDGGARHLDGLRDEGELVRLDSVGGTMLLVRADLHRDGLVFPPFPYGKANPRTRNENGWAGEIEMEGLGILADDMGVACWGLPRVKIWHACEPGCPDFIQPAIPRKIHQIWNEERLPPRYASFADGWKRLHPGWEYTLWTPDAIRQLVAQKHPELLGIYDRYREDMARLDLGRYVILQTFGGVYVDLDCECLQPISSLLPESGVALAYEPEAHARLPKAVERGIPRIPCNAFLASAPGHELWPIVFEEIAASAGQADVLDATGPFLLARALARYCGHQPVHILPTEALYPFTADDCWSGRIHNIEFWEQQTRNAHVIHFWDGTWFGHPASSSELPSEVRASIVNGNVAPVSWTGRADLPRISCLMVTRGRDRQVQDAIACFLAQNYPNKELVIVTKTAAPGLLDAVARAASPDIRLFEVGETGMTLGELRNCAVDRAIGEVICQWDDDDLSDPDRLGVQLGMLQQTGAQACLLQRLVQWWPQQQRLALSMRRPWEGSLLALKSVMPRYPALRRMEDVPVTEHLVSHYRVVTLDFPQLYVYVVHGQNTCDMSQFEHHWTVATAQYTGMRYLATLGQMRKRLPGMVGGHFHRPQAPAAFLSNPVNR
jgi:hypothetical protein